MTTATWNTPLQMNSDANFVIWRDEFITKLGLMVTAGVLAADETNITPGAGTRTINTEQGYAVYHLADSMHGTAPIYIRFGFGAAAALTTPRLQWTVGTSTNDSDVLGGTALTTISTIFAPTGTYGAATNFPSYLCVTAGYFGLIWKSTAQLGGQSVTGIARTVDNTGAITATGAQLMASCNGAATFAQFQQLRFAATASITASLTALASCQTCNFPGKQVLPQTPAGDVQVGVCWGSFPTVSPLLGWCGVMDDQVAGTATFSVALVGSTPHTYMGVPYANNTPGPGGSSATQSGSAGTSYPKFAILWE